MPLILPLPVMRMNFCTLTLISLTMLLLAILTLWSWLIRLNLQGLLDFQSYNLFVFKAIPIKQGVSREGVGPKPARDHAGITNLWKMQGRRQQRVPGTSARTTLAHHYSTASGRGRTVATLPAQLLRGFAAGPDGASSRGAVGASSVAIVSRS